VFNLQGSEIIVILLLALVVLGPEKLPDAIRKFSQTYNELKKMGTGFQSEVKSALDEPMREMRETADLLKDSVDPDKLQAEVAEEAELQRQAEAEAERMAAIDEAESVAAADRARAIAEADVAGDGPDDLGPEAEGSLVPAPEDDSPPKPINQIAQANARRNIEPAVAATPADVSIEAVPTFDAADDPTDTNAAAAVADQPGGDVLADDMPGDEANEAAAS